VQTTTEDDMKTKGLTLSYDLYIAAPAAQVWKSLTDGALTQRYFYGTKVTGKFEKGGALRYLTDGDVSMMDAEVVAIEPEKRLVTTCRALWDDAVKKDPSSQLSWEVTPMGAATRLTLLHDGFAAATPTYEQSASGWPVILSSLKTLLETGKSLVIG
jgi:uncharacterized protein YndB with AHSA1/START domain